jgi:hypothetical protein
MSDVPDLPKDWEGMLSSSRRLSFEGTRVRFGEEDENAIQMISIRYGISKAMVIRILVHKALKDL